MLITSCRIKIFGGVCLTGILAASPVLAQSELTPGSGNAAASVAGASGQLAEIIVTAQKRSENLQSVPIAVTALNADALQDAGINSALGLEQAVPGLSFNTEIGGFGLPRIRGVGISGAGPGIENPVALYIDGVYYGSASAALFDLTDISQVAVLKGPQGTLFGRNATGGLIQVTTKDPTQDFSADVSATIGNKEMVGTDLYVSGGLTHALAGSAAFHLDNQYQGFGRNLATGEDVQTHRSLATREKLLFEPDDATKFVLAADYSQRQASDFADRVVGLQAFLGTPTPGGPFDVNLNQQPSDDTRQYGISLYGQHAFGPVQLTSITAYRNTFFSAYFDADQGPLNLVDIYLVERDAQVSQEFQVLSTGNSRLTWQAGFYFYHTNDKYAPVATDLNFPGSPAAESILEATEKLNSYAGFGQATYKLSDATNLTLGARYTVDQRSIENSDIYSTAFFSAPSSSAGAKNFDAPSWLVSLDHQFSPQILGYASYNRGFKSGTFDAQSIPYNVLKPEHLDAGELGIKSQFLEDRARLNVAAFYYKYKNIQVTQYSNSIEFVYNGEGATSYGMDLDLTVKVSSDLSVNAGASYIHARYGDFPDAFKTIPNPACAGFGCGGNTVTLTGNASGNRLQDTPTDTVNIGALYHLPVSLADFHLAANYYFNSGYFSEPENRLHQPGFGVLDGSLKWNSYDNRYEARLWGKNLTNKVYPSQLSAVDVGDSRVAAPGRTFGITAGMHF